MSPFIFERGRKMFVKCAYTKRCKHKGNSTACGSCKNNHSRNKDEDLYEKADDNPIPDINPKLSYSGPAEQTAGYKCPVCNGYTNPYHVDRDDPRCACCGYLFNI